MFDSFRDSTVTTPRVEPGHSSFMPRALAAFALAAIFASGCGKKGFATGAPPGTSAESVIEKFGEPDEKMASDPPFVESLTPSECPGKERIKSGWVYTPLFRDHAMIYFDASKRVVCVREGGVIFTTVHV